MTKEINLLLVRDTFTDKSIIGELFLNDERMCDTLENPWLDNSKEYLHLLVMGVSDRSLVLVHIGNKAEDTRGCILVGLGSQQDFVSNSRLAMDLLIKEVIHLGGENIKLIIKKKVK